MEHLIDIAELERRTAIKQATLRKYVVQRKIPFVKIGRQVRFDLSEIEGWIKERKVPVLKKEEPGQNASDNGQLDFQEPSEIVHFDSVSSRQLTGTLGYMADRNRQGRSSKGRRLGT